MARVDQEAIDTFMSITGVTEAVAIQKLEEHRGNLNAAVNAHFTEGDRSAAPETSVAVPQDDIMEIDDPVELLPRRNPLSLLSNDSLMNTFSLLDPQFRRSLFDRDSGFSNRAPYVSQPREVREIPIEVKDGNDGTSSQSGHAPVIEDVTGTEHAQDPDIHGTVIVEDEEDDDDATRVGLNARAAGQNERKVDGSGGSFPHRSSEPSAPVFDNFQDYGNDIEEQMIRAAIEASKQETQDVRDSGPRGTQSHMEDPELAHAVSLSLETAEQEKALHQQRGEVGASELGHIKSAEMEMEKIPSSNGRLETGSSSIQDDADDLVEQPLARTRSRCTLTGPGQDVGIVEARSASSHRQDGSPPQHNGNAFPSDEWGGISSEEHDEAVMLEAAMFGGIPEGTGYGFPFAPQEFMQSEVAYAHRVPRPPSPSLQAQRLIREQQDDEYLASLAADREKEIKASEEAEARRLQEETAKRAALEEETRKEEELRKKLEEEQEWERQLVAKEASLPQEPASDDENAVTLLVRMPDGTRRGRRFLKSDNLKSLFDFIDIGRVVKPGTYRLVRPYPRRAFSDGDSALTLNELGLTSKQEALFMELM
ncbi:hypothetical protein K2173_021692 [Erythroxylum novogranatense]|uniref:UBX domain-containing protein n=1 Tax=Erythroxylum novogranatense TaxID=1862640 RepID=A0AAV8TIT5_9ROSI|nr:hypothetical protein K2173_021692 [Erythroxylum novogranatense]